MIKKGKKLTFDADVAKSNDLLKEFNSSNNEWIFQVLFEETIKNHDLKLFKTSDDIYELESEQKNNEELANFISVLHYNSDIFLYEEYEEHNSDYEKSNNEEVNKSIYDNPYYNDALDMDQQHPEFWENL